MRIDTSRLLFEYFEEKFYVNNLTATPQVKNSNRTEIEELHVRMVFGSL